MQTVDPIMGVGCSFKFLVKTLKCYTVWASQLKVSGKWWNLPSCVKEGPVGTGQRTVEGISLDKCKMIYILTPLSWGVSGSWLLNTANPNHSSLAFFWSRFLFLTFFSILVFCCYRLPQHLAAENNKHLLSYSFHGSQIWVQLTWLTSIFPSGPSYFYALQRSLLNSLKYSIRVSFPWFIPFGVVYPLSFDGLNSSRSCLICLNISFRSLLKKPALLKYSWPTQSCTYSV